MSYDLIPRNKNIKEKRIGAFYWPIILQKTGMGYVLGYGSSLNFGQYVYNEGNCGSPVSNDGYKVSSFEAKSMAKVARGFVSVQKFNLKQWNELDSMEELSWSDLYKIREGLNNCISNIENI